MARNDDEEDIFGGEDETEEEAEARMKRAAGKMKAFMADVGGDLLTKRNYETLVKFVRKDLEKIGFTLPHIRAYLEGFEFGARTHDQIGGNIAPVLAGLHRMVKVEEDRVKNAAKKSTGL